MWKRKMLARRDFLRLSAVAGGAAALASCAPAPPATPTIAPVPTKAAAPAAAPTTPPAPTKAAVPTSPPATTAAVAPTKAPAAAAPTKAPAAATAEGKLGKSLIGKLEGPEVILDPTKYPKTFKEAPMFAELVKQGKLPPVQERVSQDPLVVKPVHSIGKYGGAWRRGFNGPNDDANAARIASGPDTPLFMDWTGGKMVPNIVRGWEISRDGTATTLFLRRGMKWSDGQPFTADDFMFWYQDMYGDKEFNPTPSAWMAVEGKQGVLEKVDTYTVRYSFSAPNYLFPEALAFITAISHPARYGRQGSGGGYAPAHYLRQFHPKYVSIEALDKKVKDGKFEHWTFLLKDRNNWCANPELPVISPFKTVVPNNTPLWVLERNPYSIWVDTEGNQLPYIDKISMTLAENLEVLNLRAIAGEYDLQARHIDIGKIPVLVENQQKGGYKLSVHPGQWGSDYGIWFNLGYEEDAQIAKWLNNIDFRHALSIGVDRDQINETFFVGIGTPGSAAPADENKYSPGPEYRRLWATYEPAKANGMLDKVGLDKKDAEGFRLRSDGKGRLRFLITTSQSFVNNLLISEMLKEHWRKLGIDVDVEEAAGGLESKRIGANAVQLRAKANDGTEAPFNSPDHLFPTNSSHAMTLYGRWFASAGQQGKEPPPRMREVMALWQKATGVPEDERVKLAKEIWKILLEDVWYIGVTGQSGAVMGIQVHKLNMGNVPDRHTNINYLWPPALNRPMTYYWK